MAIFNKKSETPTTAKSRYFINEKTFFNMSKITTSKPVFKRNGIKNSYPYCISESYKN
jgi:hypothetical protein